MKHTFEQLSIFDKGDVPTFKQTFSIYGYPKADDGPCEHRIIKAESKEEAAKLYHEMVGENYKILDIYSVDR